MSFSTNIQCFDSITGEASVEMEGTSRFGKYFQLKTLQNKKNQLIVFFLQWGRYTDNGRQQQILRLPS